MNRRALLIGAGGAVVLLLAWYLLLWSPRQSAIHKAATRADAAEAHAQELTIQLKRLRAAQRDEPLKRATLERLRNAVPDEPAIGQFILDVNDAANRSGIDFLSIAPAQPAAGIGGGPPAVSLAISITGGYFQVLDFVNRLNALPRIVVVDGLTMNPGGTNGRLSASITGRTFVSVAAITTTTVAPSTATSTTTTVK